jgi:hypothetical protein
MIGRPALTITLSPRDTKLVLARCAATGDQPADYVTDLIRLDCDDVVGYFDSGFSSPGGMALPGEGAPIPPRSAPGPRPDVPQTPGGAAS